METLKTFKGFDANLKCRDKQYAIGETYAHGGPVEACKSGFHACEYPLDTFKYYPPATSRFAEVEQSGTLTKHDGDSKVASSTLRIVAEIGIPGLVKAAIAYTLSRCKPVGLNSPASATGDQGAASATGIQGAASATGDQGAASATGYRGAASATGDQGAASATGIQGAASATGIQGAASATGYRGAASATGEHSVAASFGIEGRARAAKGCGMVLCYRDPQTSAIKHIWSGIAGKNRIKPDTWYTLTSRGNPKLVKE